MQKLKVYSNSTLYVSKIISALLAPYFQMINSFRPSIDMNNISIQNIVILEYHRIGDVIMIIPAVQALKKKYPQAKITLICNPKTLDLAKHLEIADECIPFKAPWTDWSWDFIKWAKVISFAKKLSKRNFDLAFDFKGDLRNNWFLWVIKPKLSFGYDTTGGRYLLSNAYKMNVKIHQTMRAIELVSKVGCHYQKGIKRHKNNYCGTIVFHAGASDKRRSWPVEHWEKLADMVLPYYSVTVVNTLDSIELVDLIKKRKPSIDIFNGSLVEFMKWLEHQRCLIAPDSMAGHIAAYVGIPVISIFGSQSPDLTRPIGKNVNVILPEKVCIHKRSHWRLCYHCMKSITPKRVFSELKNTVTSK